MLSVIVCTYRRPHSLGRCLASLAQQDTAGQMWEIIVVNNYPPETPVVQQSVAAALGPAQEWRVVEAPAPGLFHARNAGLRAARGDLVCFIDDDATAHPDWLAHLAAAFQAHPQAGVIGGHIHLVPSEPRPYVLRGGRERYWSHFVTAFTGYTEVTQFWDFPWGANWAARREALARVGGFLTDFEGFAEFEQAGLAVIGDDLLTASRIQALGYRVAILPQAGVDHHVEAGRYTFGHIWQRIRAATFFRFIARRYLTTLPAFGVTAYDRAKLPALLRRRGPLPLLLWEIACHVAARLWVAGYQLSAGRRRRRP